MKLLINILIIIITSYSPYNFSHEKGQNIECYKSIGDNCDLKMRKIEPIDGSSYTVEIVDTKTGHRVFPYVDRNEPMENVTLNKINDRYIFLKEYLDSTKSLELITYKYTNSGPSDINYIYIESAVDFYNNKKQWSGKICESSSGGLPIDKSGSLLSVSSALCSNKVKLAYEQNKTIGNDILFKVSRAIDGIVKEQVSVIALDSNSFDSINFTDLGCVKNCPRGSNAVNYLGRIDKNNRIRLHLFFNGDEASGFYFYDRINKEIKITGHRSGDYLSLHAILPEGKESFVGKLNDGEYKGEWSNVKGNRKYPFVLYKNLIQ